MSYNSLQLVQRALAGLEVPRTPVGPLAVHYCARFAGVSLREYTSNARTLADCVLRYHERFEPDAVWLSADTWVTAEAMGAEVAFPGEDQPLSGTGQGRVQCLADIERIPPPDPQRQGRWPLMIEALGYIKQALGRSVALVTCFDQYPFSLACAVMGLESLLMNLEDAPDLVSALLEKCSAYTIAYGRALAEAGADVLSGGDSPAGLLGPKRYREIALPWEQRVISALKKGSSVPVSLHICGQATPLLTDMAQSGADILELDHQVDLARAAQLVGPKIALWGNLDPVGLLAQAAPATVRKSVHTLLQSLKELGQHRFVLSSGCTLAVETPEPNLQAMFDAARE
jgi:uroporphyrinogen decarboxylase